MRLSENVVELQNDNAQLRSLNDWFRNRSRDLGLAIKIFCEKLDTHGIRVVDESSSNPGISGLVPIPILADHFNISKPSRGELVYLSTSSFIENYLTSTREVAEKSTNLVPSAEAQRLNILDTDIANLNFVSLVDAGKMFGLTDPSELSIHELRYRISPLIESLNYSLSKIAQITTADGNIVALRQRATDASRSLNFKDAEAALVKVHATEFELSAATGEARAANALLIGDAQLAYDLYHANFAGYANINTEIAFERAVEYCQALYNFALNSEKSAFRLCERLALHVLDCAPSDLSWSNLMRLVGNARYNLALRIGHAGAQSVLKEVYEAYIPAKLRVDPSDHSEAWCSANQNIAVTYEALAELSEKGVSHVLLTKSISLHEETLKHLKRSELPLDWAMTRQNRGSAYRRLAVRSASNEACVSFKMSIRDLVASLLERQRITDPYGWATSTHNLANTYRDLALSAGGSAKLMFLGRAKRLYTNAMEERTLSKVPVRYALSAQNSAQTLIEMADLDQDNRASYVDEAEFLLSQSRQVFRNAAMAAELKDKNFLSNRIV